MNTVKSNHFFTAQIEGSFIGPYSPPTSLCDLLFYNPSGNSISAFYLTVVPNVTVEQTKLLHIYKALCLNPGPEAIALTDYFVLLLGPSRQMPR
jgi:hypothetical protein